MHQGSLKNDEKFEKFDKFDIKYEQSVLEKINEFKDYNIDKINNIAL